MTEQPPRPAARRKADALALLRRDAGDVWVATASADETVRAHLVPLSMGWLDDERVVIAIKPTARTGRDLLEHRTARLAVGPTRDVVMIDAVLDEVHDVGDAPAAISEGFLRQADWDPRGSAGYAYFVLRPVTVQAWREADEIAGRTLMREGRWLV